MRRAFQAFSSTHFFAFSSENFGKQHPQYNANAIERWFMLHVVHFDFVFVSLFTLILKHIEQNKEGETLVG
jgi:hypothetical protein